MGSPRANGGSEENKRGNLCRVFSVSGCQSLSSNYLSNVKTYRKVYRPTCSTAVRVSVVSTAFAGKILRACEHLASVCMQTGLSCRQVYTAHGTPHTAHHTPVLEFWYGHPPPPICCQCEHNFGTIYIHLSCATCFDSSDHHQVDYTTYMEKSTEVQASPSY